MKSTVPKFSFDFKENSVYASIAERYIFLKIQVLITGYFQIARKDPLKKYSNVILPKVIDPYLLKKQWLYFPVKVVHWLDFLLSKL